MDDEIITWIGWGALILGAGLGGSGLLQVLRAWRCQRWPRVEGRVLETEIRVFAGTRAAGGGGSGKSSHQPIVRYRYRWQDRDYESDVRCYGDYAGPRDRAERIVARYPVGADVRVAVCPHQPERAVLETDPRWGLLLPLGIALGFLAIGGLILYRAGG